MPTDQARTKCQNPSCDCYIEVGEQYCSVYCHTAGDAARAHGLPASNDETGVSNEKTAERESCQCGHSRCREHDEPAAKPALLRKRGQDG